MANAPSFWWRQGDWRTRMLAPLSAIYGQVATHRLKTAPREPVAAPVLCVGNFTVGGSGKTPVAIALAQEAKRMHLTPGFLTRGHGGRLKAPRLVDPESDRAAEVGDEPILLARHALVAVTPDRAAGAHLLLDRGCDFLIMDDGFQSARIATDYALLVVDARFAIGNGRLAPGGPLRAPLVEQLRRADAVLTMGEGEAADPIVRLAARAGRAIFQARTHPRDPEGFRDSRFLAFAGIGHPEKFFDTVAEAGGFVSLTRSFPDHHVYSELDFEELETRARVGELDMVTTAKDAARLRHRAPAAFLEKLRVLEIDAVFENPNAPGSMIRHALAAWRRRR